MRIFIIALSVWALAGAASALERRELVGVWNTQSSNSAKEPVDVAGELIIRADSMPEMLDGLSPGPGMDGVLSGETSVAADGSVIWAGTWASIWPEGATQGTFRLVFTNADTFTGTWSSHDGEIVNAQWNGQRAR